VFVFLCVNLTIVAYIHCSINTTHVPCYGNIKFIWTPFEIGEKSSPDARIAGFLILLRDTDFTDDNASYTVTSKCWRFRTKIRVSKATSPECVLFSSRYIYQFVCLSLYMCVSLLLSIILVLRFLSIRSKGRTKRKNRQTVIPNTVYPSLRERVV
jgi:hypothetical protein